MPVKPTQKKPKVLLTRSRGRKNVQVDDSENNKSAVDLTITAASRTVSTMRDPDLSLQSMNSTRSGGSSQCRRILQLFYPLVEKVQKPGVNTEEALRQMEQYFNEFEKKNYAEVLWRIMLVPFTVPKGNENTERIVQFFYKVITTVGKDFEKLGKDALYIRMLRLCIKYYRERRIHVRYRVVETIGKILQTHDAKDNLPKDIKEGLLHVLFERIKDKHHSVRIQSAIAVGFMYSHFENPKIIRNISTLLVYALTSDPNWEVRKAAVKSLAVDRSTIDYFVQKVNDKSDPVKIAALSVISEKIPIRTFTISQRECVLHSSLNDVPANVKKFGLLVLEKWQESCNGNLPELLQKLDVIENEKLCYLVLNTLFREPNADNFERIDMSCMERKLIPFESLTVERTFLWLFLFRKFCHDPYYQDKLMPTPKDMFAYIKSFLDQPITEDSDTKKEKLHFMLKHLLHILKFLKLEEGGRCQMKEIIALVFRSDHLSGIHINLLVQLLHKCFLDGKEEGLMTIVNSVLEDSIKSCPSEPCQPVVVAEKIITELKLELANVMHQRHKRKRDQDEAVTKNNFILAQECKDDIEALEQKQEILKTKLQNCTRPEINRIEENSEDEEEPEYSTSALCIALSTIIAHVQITQTVSTQVRHFYEHRVSNEMHKFEDPWLRQQTLKLMTLVGFQNFEDAEKSMIFCIQGVMRDQRDVQVVALKCVFDLVLQYSFEEFEVLKKVIQVLNSGDIDKNESRIDGTISPLKLLTLSFLGSMDTTLLDTSVEGVIKLLLSNKLHSPKVVQTLLLIWANPPNLQTKIYKDVQRWLPIYANTGLTQGLLIANALVPCIHKILTCKSSSPLSDASIESLAAFVLQSTDQKTLQPINWAHKIHEAIALNILEDMKQHLCTPRSIIFARMLKQLDLKNCDVGSLSNMLELCKPLTIDLNRHVRSIVTDFILYLKSLGGIVEENDDDDSDTRPGSQSVRTAGDSDAEESFNVNEDFFSESDEESLNDTVITRSPTVMRLSQQSLSSTRSLQRSRVLKLPSRRNVLSPIVSDNESQSNGDSSDGSLYGPTPPV